MFFIASGMNVLTFWDRNRVKEGFAMTRFYLGQALLLFTLGYTYNIGVGSIILLGGVPDIFQGVALCTAFVYLVTRYLAEGFRLFDSCRDRLRRLPPGAYENRSHDGGHSRHALLEKQFFAHFSLFPWAVFFLLGAAIYRTRSRVGEIALGGLFIAMIVGSLFIEQAYFGSTAELVFRGVPGYVLQTGAGGGLAFLVLRHVYRGPGTSRFSNGLEFAGKESLLFLILHYFLIILVYPFPMPMYFRAALIVIGTALLLPVFARRRDRLIKAPSALTGLFVVMAVGALVGLALRGPMIWFGRIAGFSAALAFAFAFGELRTRWRARTTAAS
ncbi:MAG: hypothetical protein M5R36_13600 [Deltaproteobacteria bacterium]|nr:hypothetical protein [Deltaproteobacteria bacterium]